MIHLVGEVLAAQTQEPELEFPDSWKSQVGMEAWLESQHAVSRDRDPQSKLVLASARDPD